MAPSAPPGPATHGPPSGFTHAGGGGGGGAGGGGLAPANGAVVIAAAAAPTKNRDPRLNVLCRMTEQ
jgi:hypothetical protein